MADQIITRTDFVSMPTRDLEKAVAFYGETVGLKRSKYRPDRNFAEFETDNLTINLYMPEKMGFEHVVSGNPLALHVNDMDEARKELESRGVKFQGDAFDTGVCYMSFFNDPDGNVLMLHHRYAPPEE